MSTFFACLGCFIAGGCLGMILMALIAAGSRQVQIGGETQTMTAGPFEVVVAKPEDE